MAADPDPRRFEDLYRSHRAAVYGALLRELRSPEDAEDATQTAFLQAFGAYERGSRPERPRAWLLTIAGNLRRRRFRSDRGAGELPLDEKLVGARTRDPRVDDLREALDALPRNQSSAFVLREVAGLSYAEIARHLSVSVNAVQMLIFRARRALRESLATPSRGAGALLPCWLANLLHRAERLTALRVGGVAVVAAAAAVAVTGAESAAPPAVDEHHLPPLQAHAIPPVAPAFVSQLASKRAAERARRTTVVDIAPTATVHPVVARGASTLAAPSAEPRLLPVRVPLPAPKLELPEVVALPPIDLPKALEGTQIPQLDGVLAGR